MEDLGRDLGPEATLRLGYVASGPFYVGAIMGPRAEGTDQQNVAIVAIAGTDPTDARALINHTTAAHPGIEGGEDLGFPYQEMSIDPDASENSLAPEDREKLRARAAKAGRGPNHVQVTGAGELFLDRERATDWRQPEPDLSLVPGEDV